uniref:Uncharacterized protein n=1 Tax=Nelumbo nucifera TaxID=4432 RepID=A0A822YP71_NELNU|nr:TPA_asm: hypothetical protein HUJ06_012754 [Nelumbo nucifera]
MTESKTFKKTAISLASIQTSLDKEESFPLKKRTKAISPVVLTIGAHPNHPTLVQMAGMRDFLHQPICKGQSMSRVIYLSFKDTSISPFVCGIATMVASRATMVASRATIVMGKITGDN